MVPPLQGYFTDTVMYYGFYTNSTIRHRIGGTSYHMQLAYIFTIGTCLVICLFSLLFRYAQSVFPASMLFFDLGKIQGPQKLPRKQFPCNPSSVPCSAT